MVSVRVFHRIFFTAIEVDLKKTCTSGYNHSQSHTPVGSHTPVSNGKSWPAKYQVLLLPVLVLEIVPSVKPADYAESAC